LSIDVAPARRECCDLRQRLRVIAVSIQQGQLAGLFEQGLMFVLTVNFDQVTAFAPKLQDVR